MGIIRKETWKNISLVMISVVLSLYMLNVFLIVLGQATLSGSAKTRLEIAAEQGIPYDTRSRREAYADFVSKGMKVQPVVAPRNFVGKELIIDGEKVLPLSGIPRTLTLGDKESGTYHLYQTDELGFHNAVGTHSREKIDIALLGDSFAFGAAIPTEDNIASQLERRGLLCINYGSGGNGPLLELATLREYALSKIAKNYVWLLYRNDIYDVLEELKSPVLMNYFNDPNYRQGLHDMVPLLDQAMRKYVITESHAQKSATDPKNIKIPSRSFGSFFLDVVLLRSIRGALGLQVFSSISASDIQGAALLVEAISKGRTDIEKQGGRLTVVFLPSYPYFNDGSTSVHDLVLADLEKLSVAVLDITPIMAATGDPLQFFPFRKHGHYNKKGYELVADAIYESLVKQGQLAQ